MSDLTTRILDSVPAGTYAMDALLRLVDIVETGEIPTAAIQGGDQPRLLINPGFVAQHAATPERLLMLVLHELHHVILGHTRAFPVATPLDDIVFDAVINALLCRADHDPRRIALLTDFYAADHLPDALLRPAPGWKPDRPVPTSPHIARLGSPRLAAVHQALYSPSGVSYEELADALREVAPRMDVAGAILLGGHGEGGLHHGHLDRHAPALLDALRPAMDDWPTGHLGLGERQVGQLLGEAFAPPRPVASNRRILRALLAWAAGEEIDGPHRRRAARPVTATVPFPTRSRRDVVLGMLGSPILLHEGSIERDGPTRSGERVHVYLDVSGSISSFLPVLAGAVTDCARFVHPVVHAFSTTIADATLDELRRGRVRSTGGTDIRCAAEHARTMGVRRAVIITDGEVGRPQGIDHHTLQGMRLGAAWTVGAQPDDLAAVIGHSAQLEAPR